MMVQISAPCVLQGDMPTAAALRSVPYVLLVSPLFSVVLTNTHTHTHTALILQRAGTYSGWGATNCTLCPKGTWSPMPDSGSIDNCHPCGYGKFSSIEGATSQDNCTQCPAGTYSGLEVADSPTRCSACPAGKYSYTTGARDDTVCTDCPAGTFSGKQGADKVVFSPLFHFAFVLVT